ncbi:hypothetical protein [Streptomyces sp. NPDC057545]|uniref:hypothetical protein n=1 Tax=Streptomyces sp. NPDC057545 TaxID=3346164 RepID=UPI0036776927
MRVKIVTPEMEAAERRAGILIGLTLIAAVVQTIGIIYLSLALKGEHPGQASLGAICAVLGAWGVLYVDARGHRRPFRWLRFIVTASLSIALGLVIGL